MGANFGYLSPQDQKTLTSAYNRGEFNRGGVVRLDLSTGRSNYNAQALLNQGLITQKAFPKEIRSITEISAESQEGPRSPRRR